MRVSTSMIFNNGTAGMQNRQSDLYKVQNQLNTGRRILSPEDDPIGASEALVVGQSKGVNEMMLDNQANAQTQLSYLESTLGSVSDVLLRVIELGAMASQSSGTGVAQEVPELKGLLTNLIGLANTQNGEGQYIFSGYKTTTKPFEVVTPTTPPPSYSLATPSVTYEGDSGKTALQVTLSQVMAISENGQDIFMQVRGVSGAVAGKSLFDSVQNMINNLDGSVPFSAADHETARAEITAALSHISSARASVGARQNSLDQLTSAGDDVSLLYDTRLSEIQDLDYTEAISRYANLKMQLEATQLSFKQTSQLSLFNIL